jgi:hypothetical protein
MYQFSRSIYRALAPRVLDDGDADGSARQSVRDACERTIVRLAEDPRYFPRPSRSLFLEVRRHFALADHLLVYQLIDMHMKLAQSYLAALPPTSNAFGEVRRCRAFTRSGSPCRREPLEQRDYCPSHKHLEEVFGFGAGIDATTSPAAEPIAV